MAHIVYLVQKAGQRDEHDNTCAVCKALRRIAVKVIVRSLSPQ